jgi:hypothetical protein
VFSSTLYYVGYDRVIGRGAITTSCPAIILLDALYDYSIEDEVKRAAMKRARASIRRPIMYVIVRPRPISITLAVRSILQEGT